MARKPKAAPPASPSQPPPQEPLDAVQIQIDRGQLVPAIAALLPALERRAEAGDRACALAARLLQISPVAEPALPRPPDALAATLDRLVRLVDRQEEQIRTLRALVEEEL